MGHVVSKSVVRISQNATASKVEGAIADACILVAVG